MLTVLQSIEISHHSNQRNKNTSPPHSPAARFHLPGSCRGLPDPTYRYYSMSMNIITLLSTTKNNITCITIDTVTKHYSVRESVILFRLGVFVFCLTFSILFAFFPSITLFLSISFTIWYARQALIRKKGSRMANTTRYEGADKWYQVLCA